MIRNSILRNIFTGLIFVCLTASAALAQTTAFNYQGKLSDAGAPANGSYQLQFKLFDASGTQIGATLSDVAVAVTNGVFTTQLDFGAAAFPGADRFLEVSVRHNAGESYTALSPRQKVMSTPMRFARSLREARTRRRRRRTRSSWAAWRQVNMC